MKKTIISFCTVAIAAGTILTSCQKEATEPSNKITAGSATVSSMISKGPGWVPPIGDSTKTKTQP